MFLLPLPSIYPQFYFPVSLRCQCQKKWDAYFWAQAASLPQHIFIMKSQHGIGWPCTAAGLICSKHVQIGRPTQTIKVEWRFCSTRHFCLTRGNGTPSKEQTDHKRKEKRKHTKALSHESQEYSRRTQEDGLLLLSYLKQCLQKRIPFYAEQMRLCPH